MMNNIKKILFRFLNERVAIKASGFKNIGMAKDTVMPFANCCKMIDISFVINSSNV